MKRNLFLLVTILILTLCVSCKEKELFYEPDKVLNKWARAIEKLDYKSYKSCEASPKEQQTFYEMYKEYYPTDVMVVDVSDLDEEDVRETSDGEKYLVRNVQFEWTEVQRETRKPVKLMRGDIDFIQFQDEKRRNEGWLMFNRTLIEIKR